MVSTNDTAPDFTLPALDGLTYSLHEALDKGPLLLVFLQAHCGACKTAAPYLNRLYDAYENIGWSFWCVSQDDEATAREFAQQHDFRPTLLIDRPAFAASDAYDPEETPSLYLIEPDGRTSIATGGFDKEALNDISARVAAYTGADPVIVAPEDDGVPAFKPG